MDLYSDGHALFHNILFGNDFRAYIYYDRDNTSYYGDFASRSLVNEIGANKMRADTNRDYADNRGWWLHDPYGQGWGKPHGSFRSLEVSTSGNFSTEPAMFRIHQWGSGSCEWWKPQGTTVYLRETPGGGGSWFTRYVIERFAENTESFRAPIFFDSNNTGYYIDPTSTTSLRTVGSWRADSSGWDGEFNGKIQYHSNHWYFQSGNLWLFRNAGGSNVIEFTQGGRIYYSDYIVSRNRGGMMGDYNSTGTADKVIWTIGESWPLGNMYGLAYDYGSGYDHHLAMRNNGTTYSRIGFAGGAFIGATLTAGGDMRAPIFYDSNDTSFFVDPNGNSRSNLHRFQRIGFPDSGNAGDGFPFARFSEAWGIVFNSPDTRWTLSTTGAFLAGFISNGADWGSGRVLANNDMRAPIFYDWNDTSWYVDPNSNSNLQFTEVRRYGFRYPGGDSGLGADAYNLFQEGGGWGFPFPDLRIAYHTGVKLGANASYEGFRIYDDYPMGTIRFQFNGSAGYQWQYTWTNFTGHHGVYSNINSAHFYPNDASYGSWRMLGTRNGWHGIHFGGGNGMTLMMNEGEFGFHREAVGWTARFNSGFGFFSVSGTSGDITTSNITRAPQLGGADFNGLTGFSFSATAVANANGPFGNGFWYNILNVRHQGGVGDGNIWGGQIVWGMTAASFNIAFRTQVAGNWNVWSVFSHSNSDATLKVEDGYIENGIDLVMKLKPRYYYWKYAKQDNLDRRAGFFAQEVYEVSPESAIEPKAEDVAWGVEDRGLIAILTKAIQEQQVLIQQMQEEINNLKNR
jgi:hypothetical protein